MASSLQRDMSQASSDCLSWKDGVWRLTKEVAEQSTKRIAGRAPRITHLFIHKHQEQIVRNPSRRQNELVHSSFQPLRPAEGNPWEHILSSSTALSDTRSVHADSSSKRKEAEKFESAQWPQASRVKPAFGNQFLRFFDARCRASRKPLYFIASSRLPQAEWEVRSKAVKTCPKPIEYFKVWLEDWLVQNFELTKDFSFVNYHIHQAAVNMPHHPMKVTKSISIMELFCWSSDWLCQPTQSITPDTSISQEGSIYQSNWKRSRKSVRTTEGNGCSCKYRKSPSEDYFWEALTVRNFHDQPLESREKPRENEKNQECPWKALLRLKAYFRQKRKASTSHIRVWREQNSETQFHLWARSKQVVKTEDLQMHHRPKSTKPNFFRRYVLAKAKSAATGMAIHSKERMYIVDSGASLRNDVIIFSESQRKEDYSTFKQQIWIFRSPMTLWCQTHTAKVYINELGASLWIHVVKDSPSVLSLGRPCK